MSKLECDNCGGDTFFVRKCDDGVLIIECDGCGLVMARAKVTE